MKINENTLRNMVREMLINTINEGMRPENQPKAGDAEKKAAQSKKANDYWDKLMDSKTRYHNGECDDRGKSLKEGMRPENQPKAGDAEKKAAQAKKSNDYWDKLMDSKTRYHKGECDDCGNALKEAIKRAVKNVMKESYGGYIDDEENDEFTPHAGRAESNYGGTEIQISNNGEAARLRSNWGTPGQPTDWLEIQFDENGVAYVETPEGEQVRLDEFMRY